MQTVIQLQNSNCGRCLDIMSNRLLARPLVRQVHVDASTGCLLVEHDHEDPGLLVAQIHDDLRGWELADNGERVMVDLDVHEESQCQWQAGHQVTPDHREESAIMGVVADKKP